jgi:hypothetical protein
MASRMRINGREPVFLIIDKAGQPVDAGRLTNQDFDVIQHASDNSIANVKQTVKTVVSDDLVKLGEYLSVEQANDMTSAEISEWLKSHKDR